MHVETLSTSEYKETAADSILPTYKLPQFASAVANRTIIAPVNRLHHIDAQEISPNNWVFLIDGENFGNGLKQKAPFSGKYPMSTVTYDETMILTVIFITLFILLCRQLPIHFPCNICFFKENLSNFSCSYHSISDWKLMSER